MMFQQSNVRAARRSCSDQNLREAGVGGRHQVLLKANPGEDRGATFSPQISTVGGSGRKTLLQEEKEAQ